MICYLKLMENEKRVNALRVEIFYEKGSPYSAKKRGYYLSIVPVERRIQGGLISEAFTAYTGARVLLLETARKSAKAERAALEIAERQKDKFIDYVLKSNGLSLDHEAANF